MIHCSHRAGIKCRVSWVRLSPVGIAVVLGPEYGEEEAEEKHHQAEANQADDCKDTD